MKTFQSITLSLFFVSLHQALFCITDRDVRSFGERNNYICQEINTNTEYDRLCAVAAEQNSMRNEQATPMRQASKPIAIKQQQEKTEEPKSIVTTSPNSVWGWVISSVSTTKQSTPDIK